MFNLATLKEKSQTTKVFLFDYEGKVTKYFIEIHSAESKRYNALKWASQDEARKRDEDLDLSAEETEKKSINMIIACIESWNVKDGKKIAEINKENVEKVFTACSTTYKQLMLAMHKESNFLASAPKS